MQVFFLFFLVAVLLTMWGRGRFLKVYGQESGNLLASGVTGAELAERILRKRGVEGVSVVKGHGPIPDFYDPEKRVITLAPQHFGGASYSALALSALQAGKAIQQHEKHRPLLWRTASVRWSVYLGLPLLFAGLVAVALGLNKTVLPLIVLFWSLLAFWNFITLPTELDAGSRAKRELEEMRFFRNLDERVGVERVMGAACTAHIDGLSVMGSWAARKLLPWLRGKGT